MHYLSHLSSDKKLKPIIKKHGAVSIKKRNDIFNALIGSIMSQQLSTKVAAVFHKRFLDLYGGKFPLPQQLLETPFETLRSIGLSNAKANYLLNIARFALEQGLDPRKLHKMNNEEATAYLTQIKGVGQWTTEMLLMFSMGREDIFPIGDLGIQQAMIKLYDVRARKKKNLHRKLIQIASAWSPYRTYACMYLW
jgi:DNA-3-methyladenine glycosylase II